MDTKSIPKSCSTCEHRTKGFAGQKCNLSGYYTEIERRYTTKCGTNFEGWEPRLGVLQRIKFWWNGAD